MSPVQIFTLSQSTVTLVAAVIGFLAAIMGRFVARWYEKRIRRKKLRAAFLAEVRTTKTALKTASEADEDERPVHSNFPDDVYQANHDDIGLLTVPEIERLVNYYNLLYEASEQLDPDEPFGELSDFLDTAENTNQAREDAETALVTHQRWFGKWRFRLSQWRSDKTTASDDEQAQESGDDTDQSSGDGDQQQADEDGRAEETETNN